MTNWLFTHTERLTSGQDIGVEIEYDPEGDALEILFTRGSGRGVELCEELILRYDAQTNQPLSLIFIGFSHFIEQTSYGGPGSYLLTGLQRLPSREREQIWQILTSFPVKHFVSVLSSSSAKFVHQTIQMMLHQYHIREMEKQQAAGYAKLPVQDEEFEGWEEIQMWDDE